MRSVVFHVASLSECRLAQIEMLGRAAPCAWREGGEGAVSD
jgi:hypothetical protein